MKLYAYLKYKKNKKFTKYDYIIMLQKLYNYSIFFLIKLNFYKFLKKLLFYL